MKHIIKVRTLRDGPGLSRNETDAMMMTSMEVSNKLLNVGEPEYEMYFKVNNLVDPTVSTGWAPRKGVISV